MHRPRRPALSLLATASAVSILFAASAGCASLATMKPGGRMASLDQHTYVSDTYTPKTVRLIDTRTLEEIWSVDVPVDQKLVIKFYDNTSKGNYENPDIMRWEIFPADRWGELLDNQMPVPAKHARRIEWEIRTGPEFAPDENPQPLDIMPDEGLQTSRAGG